ncbi:hypothetical protein BW731_11425 [Vagococcus martis]|uniref:Thioredoxin domain-containing protein n=1 Tax=Vagococcus martis TaxID=1768210 RepID=A0A1V4DJU1_9ENTE|nr:thioredoxin family protein [Vagococcus martis]OPF88731.1 hypothetical protein BW731_11425 [Vagococcus martis]
MFKQVKEINKLNELVQKEGLTLVYFSQPNCSVCHGLKPQVKSKLAEFSEDITFLDVNTFDIPEVSGEYQVMTVPVILLFLDGKEYLRKARFVPVVELYNDVKKIVDGVNSMN